MTQVSLPTDAVGSTLVQPAETEVDATGDLVGVPVSVLAELREAAVSRGLVRPGGWRSVAHLAGLVATWAALDAVGFWADTLWVWIPAWLGVAFLIIGLTGAGHDCVHATLTGSKRPNTAIGHVVMSAIAVPFETYRQFHLLHHADTIGITDPEGPPADFSSRLQYLLFHAVLGVALISMLWWGTIRAAFGRPPAWARTAHSRRALRRAWFPALPVLVLFVAASATSDVFRHVWLFPWLLVLTPVFPFVLVSEHYAGRAADGILHNTYTIRSNAITRFAVFNINFHTAHHLIPRVPGDHLCEFDQFVSPYATRTATGYLAFHRSILAPLPWRARRPPSGEPEPPSRNNR